MSPFDAKGGLNFLTARACDGDVFAEFHRGQLFLASSIKSITLKLISENGANVLDKKLSALKKLGSLPSDPSHQEEFEKQLSAPVNDRGFCLLLASTQAAK